MLGKELEAFRPFQIFLRDLENVAFMLDLVLPKSSETLKKVRPFGGTRSAASRKQPPHLSDDRASCTIAR